MGYIVLRRGVRFLAALHLQFFLRLRPERVHLFRVGLRQILYGGDAEPAQKFLGRPGAFRRPAS